MTLKANTDEWYQAPEPARRAHYATVSAALNEIVTDVRNHRSAAGDECDGAPLCPGFLAGVKVNSVPKDRHEEFLLTCLAGLVDRDETIDSLRNQLHTAISTRAAEAARLEGALTAAKVETDAGWDAYRNALAKIGFLEASLKSAQSLIKAAEESFATRPAHPERQSD